LFDSHHHPVGRDHTVTVALVTAAFVFIPALVLISQPVTYWPGIGMSVLCVSLAFLHSRNVHSAFGASPAIARSTAELKAPK
jgi:hypothetical protein